ncbi:hypothetical protein NEIRO03_0869 [Nematocida sp. AWRm78]|nr:hypothetical protein NEIRO02_1134 [Nematocida sp. AWRm79]KAI5183254.1 hypothetical protein NEIRO03_0869 [Nematocida sp. AWRm78]
MAWSKKKILAVAGLVAAGGIGALAIGSTVGKSSKKSEEKSAASSKPAVKPNDSSSLMSTEEHTENKKKIELGKSPSIESGKSPSIESWMASTKEKDIGYYSDSDDSSFGGAGGTEKCPQYPVESHVFNLNQEVNNNPKNNQLEFIIDKSALENICPDENSTERRAAKMNLRRKRFMKKKRAIGKLSLLKKIKTPKQNLRKASAVEESSKLNEANNNDSTIIANPLILENNEKENVVEEVEKVEKHHSNEECNSEQSSSEKSHENQQEMVEDGVQLEVENQAESEIRETVKFSGSLKSLSYNTLQWFKSIIELAKFKRLDAVNPLHNRHSNILEELPAISDELEERPAISEELEEFPAISEKLEASTKHAITANETGGHTSMDGNYSVTDNSAVEEDSNSKYNSSANEFYSAETEQDGFEADHNNEEKGVYIFDPNELVNNYENNHSNSKVNKNSSASSSISSINNSKEELYIQEINECMMSNKNRTHADSISSEGTSHNDSMSSNYEWDWDNFLLLKDENDSSLNTIDLHPVNRSSYAKQEEIPNLSQNRQGQSSIDTNNPNNTINLKLETAHKQNELSENERLNSLRNSYNASLNSMNSDYLPKNGLRPMNNEFYQVCFVGNESKESYNLDTSIILNSKESENNSEKPKESENSSEQPKESENSSEQPKESENSSEKPKESENNSEQPKESENNSEQPKESENSSEKPKESENSSEKPKESENNSEKPKELENNLDNTTEKSN